MPRDVRFFPTPPDLRAWFAEHGESERELWLGYHRVESGLASVTWPQSVDEALCVGWIDGIRRSLNGTSYTIRFTPRRPGSTWSAVNAARVADLTAQGRMLPAGLRAWEARRDDRTASYSYERAAGGLGQALEDRFRSHAAAWAFFAAQPAGYRRTASDWVLSAKREETRERRFAVLVDDSAHGRRIAALAAPPRTR